MPYTPLRRPQRDLDQPLLRVDRSLARRACDLGPCKDVHAWTTSSMSLHEVMSPTGLLGFRSAHELHACSLPPMGGLTGQQLAKLVYSYIGVSGGYLGSFSYESHRQFYPLYCDLDVNPYDYEGTTRQRFEQIVKSLSPQNQAKVLRGAIEKFPVGEQDAPDSRTERLRDELLRLAASLEGVQLRSGFVGGRDSVTRALADAELLLRNGPVSGVDRIHTALHGYLMDLCDRARIGYPAEPTMAKLLKVLRAEHPRLKDLGPRAADIERVLNSFANVLDALNPLRNQASVAHPNEALMDAAEARLVINAARTILAYLDEKLEPAPVTERTPVRVPAQPPAYEEEPF